MRPVIASVSGRVEGLRRGNDPAGMQKHIRRLSQLGQIVRPRTIDENPNCYEVHAAQCADALYILRVV